MEKKWIKFLQEYTQKSKDSVGKTVEKSFKEDDVIQVEKKLADSLIQLGFAEETEEPKSGDNLDEPFKKMTDQLENMIEGILTKSLEKLASKAEKSFTFATPKSEASDLERESGFKSIAHFYKAVQAAEHGVDFPGKEFLFKAPSGQQISNDSEGNFLVPEVISDQIWSNLMDEPASILPQTLQMTTAGNSMKIPRFFESSRKTGEGQRNGGVIAYWVDEGGELTASKFTTGKESLELHKLAALLYATSEILEDGTSIERFIRQLAPRAINFEVANALIVGTGVGKPYGVLKSDATVFIPAVDRAGTAISADNLSHFMLSEMYWKNINRDRAIWYAHPNTAQLLEFVYFDDDTTNKRPAYFPAGGMGTGGLTQSPFGTIYARPVVPYEFMPNKNQAGTLALIDWSQYASLTKAGGGIRFASSIHVRFLNDETAFRFTFRIDGRSLWTSPKEDLNGTTQRSPFTALAAIASEGSSSGL